MIPAPIEDDTTLDVRPNLEREPFVDLADKPVLTGLVARVGVLPDGTADGNPVLLVVIGLEDDTEVIGVIPYAAAEVAGRALAAVWSERT